MHSPSASKIPAEAGVHAAEIVLSALARRQIIVSVREAMKLTDVSLRTVNEVMRARSHL